MKTPAYKLCRNCRHVRTGQARAGHGWAEFHLCAIRPDGPYRVVPAKHTCPRFEPARIPIPDPAPGTTPSQSADEQCCLIPLSQGLFALVDEADYPALARHKWCASKMPTTHYAVRASGRIRMHRTIMQPPPGMVVDHINHNGLDNRRANLRICTQRQNARNCRPANKTSRYKGVSWHKSSKKWVAAIRLNNATKHLGLFPTEKQAAKAYDQAAQKTHGPYACLNFPNAP